MKAAVLEELEQLKIVEKPDPVCGDDEVIIAPQAVSVCGSDVRIFHYGNDRVETPTVIGHEVAGEVIDGSASRVWPQAANRMHAARGLLAWLLGEGAES